MMIEPLDKNLEDAYDRGYKQGRADKYQEITSEYMLLTEKQVAEIRADAIEGISEIVNSTFLNDAMKILNIQRWLKEQSSQ